MTRSWWVGLALAASTVQARPARACSYAGPGISGREMWPASGQPVPVNARLVIAYTASQFGGFAFPALGRDAGLSTADGTPVAASIEVMDYNVVITPAAALLPGVQYRVTDHRVVPCLAIDNGCALATEPQVVGTVVGAAIADVAPPRFGGLASMEVGPLQSCDGDACCGPHRLFPVMLSWTRGVDDLAGPGARYNVYVDKFRESGQVLTRVGSLIDGDRFYGSLACTALPAPFPVAIPPGPYVVRAVDWAGNEDGNTAVQFLFDNCAGVGPGGAGGAPAGGAGGAPGPGTGGASGAGGASAGADVPGGGFAARADGCPCSASGAGGAATATPLLLLALAALTRRRPRG